MREKLHQTQLVAAVATRTGLRGLGTLEVRPTAPRTGVRPATGEKIELPAGRKVVFRISPDLQGQL